MIELDIFSLFYDVIAYLIAARSLVDEILYKLGWKRRLNFEKDLPSDLSGRVAIVTGGTRGLGLTVVKTLISRGCTVVVASSQNGDKFGRIKDLVYDELPTSNPMTNIKRGYVRLMHLDLSSMESVAGFIDEFKSSQLNLNYLICNAGIMFAPRKITLDNFESHFAVNYLGHTLITKELLPLLKKTADETNTNSRIVNVASSTHRITRVRLEDLLGEANYSSSQAYAQSKLAQIMFTAKMSRFLRNDLGWTNVQCFSLHPGVILSELYEHVSIIKYFPFLIPIIKLFTREMHQGAETILYAALSPELNHLSGLYLEDCSLKESSRRSKDEGDQDRLWDITNALLAPWSKSDLFETKKTK